MDIRIEHLTKRYGGQTAVDDVSFVVRTGEVLGFLGPNGAGKTTTMRMVLGLLTPDAGRVTIGERDVAHDHAAIRRTIGYLPESNPLYEDMPVLDLLRFSARVQGVERAAVPARLREMVEVCGLGAEKHKRVGELSKGYRQRVGLAQAMVHDPQVLILDEPTSGLDPNQIVEIRTLIQRLGQAKTVIFSTHILPEVEAACDRVLIIDKGRIVADGSPGALRARSQGVSLVHVRIEGGSPETIMVMLGACDQVLSVSALSGTSGTYELRTGDATMTSRAVFRACVQAGLVLTTLHTVETRLEDVFRELTLN
jgi:ABC-2 type transport system ATP-binding protein